jgi:putative endonuclease
MGELEVRRGRLGEDVAADYLEARGWRIVARNWRDGPRELDLVACRGGVLAFVEVKARRRGGSGQALEAIGRTKRRDLERAARAWLGRGDRVEEMRCSPPSIIRFDAVIVRLDPRGRHRVEHLPDAWRPGWGMA